MNETPVNSRRFFSLRLKWALGTSVGSLLISLGLTFIIFTSFTSDLMHQEQQALNMAMTNVEKTLVNQNQALTATSVREELADQLQSQTLPAKESFFHQSLVQSLGKQQIELAVYSPQGKVLYQSGQVHTNFKPTLVKWQSTAKLNGHQILIGRQPIRLKDGRIIGYVQVENNLNQYYQRYHHQLIVVGLTLLLVVIFSGIFGYALSWLFLRPLDEIRSTVQAISDDPTKDARVPVPDSNDELTDLVILFNQMLDRMQRYIDQQSQFVGDVSHELRTPVAIVQGHMQLLQRWGKDDPQVLNDSIAASLKETERMNNLVQEMLDLSRAEQVELNFRDATTPVKEVVMQVYNNFKMIHPDFTFIMDDDLDQEVISPIFHDHLEQILIILGDNAVKYSTNRPELDFSLSRSAKFVEIGIQDYGEGIADDELDKVFDRFYRVDKARSRKKGGNGLGLAIAKRLIEGYHGTITLESTLGSGSVFTIQLPIVETIDE